VLPTYFKNLRSWEKRQEQKEKAKLELRYLDHSKPELKPEIESGRKTEDAPENLDDDQISHHNYGSETYENENTNEHEHEYEHEY
jgi:hypothetical protein